MTSIGEALLKEALTPKVNAILNRYMTYPITEETVRRIVDDLKAISTSHYSFQVKVRGLVDLEIALVLHQQPRLWESKETPS